MDFQVTEPHHSHYIVLPDHSEANIMYDTLRREYYLHQMGKEVHQVLKDFILCDNTKGKCTETNEISSNYWPIKN